MGCSCSRDLASELILAQQRTGMACLGICNDRGLGEQARQASARDRAGMAPALPSPPGAFVTEAIFPRVTEQTPSAGAAEVSPLCSSACHPRRGGMEQGTQHSLAWSWGHNPASATPSARHQAGPAGQHQPPLSSSLDQSLWDQPPPPPEQSWGAQGPRPCPEGLRAPRGEQSYFTAGFNTPFIQLRDEK